MGEQQVFIRHMSDLGNIEPPKTKCGEAMPVKPWGLFEDPPEGLLIVECHACAEVFGGRRPKP